MAEWTLDMSKYTQKIANDINRVRQVFAFELLRRVIMRSPVDTGRFRSNWLTTVNNETGETRDTTDKSGNSSLQEGQTIIDNVKGDEKIIIQNNMSYATKIEYGGFTKKPETAKTIGGYSRQSPKGVIGTVMAQADQLFKATVNAVKGGGS
jgi:hypothetical protein